MAEPKTSNKKKAAMGVFALAMLNVAAIVTLKNLPMMAEYGFALVFYLLFCSLCFFIPSALVAAELATGWPKDGGIYLWVKEGLGERWGFVAIWLQWVENLPWFPTTLAFAAATMAYAFNPALASNKFYTLCVVLVVFWGSTLLNFRGMKASSAISTIGAIAGTLIPGVLILVLGVIWLIMGKPSAITFSTGTFFPDLGNLQQLMLLAGMLLSIAGMEMSAVHASEVKDPKKDYPKAILISTIIILVIMIFSSLAIAIVVPKTNLSLVAGVMEAFEYFFKAYNLDWLTPILAGLIALGAFATVSTWIVGPTKGLVETAKNGDLPIIFQKKNKQDMPVNILYVQAGFVTLIALVILFMPSVSGSFWIMTALAAQLYLMMYILMFIAAIRLRYIRPDVPRPYKIPGGKIGMWIVAGLGTFACVFAILFGFVPTQSIKTVGQIIAYEGFLVGGCVIFSVIPLIIYHFRKPEWKSGEEADTAQENTGD